MKTKLKPKHSNEYRQDLRKFPSRRGRSFHHFHYEYLRVRVALENRSSIYWLDGMYLPGGVHIPIIRRILGGGEYAGSQPFGRFPNVAQRLAHWVCRVVFVVF
jgi:hypothetical protein